MRALVRCLAAAFLVLAGSLALAVAAASAADRIYWSNSGDPGDHGIGFADVDGTDGGSLSIAGTQGTLPFGIALDSQAGRIYVAEFDNSISFAGLGDAHNGDVTVTSATADHPTGVAVDPVNRRLYWTNVQANKIASANLDGPGDGDLTISGATVATPTGVAVDPVAGRIYWTDSVGSKLSSAKLDGGDAHDLTIVARTMSKVSVNQPLGLAVDPVHGRIYWINETGVVSSAKLDGTDGFDLPIGNATASAATPGELAIDPFGGRVYWTSADADAIFSANLDGTDAHAIAIAGTTPDKPSSPLLALAPRAAGLPAVTGGAEAGATLSCSPGTWAPDVPASFFYESPQSFAFQWSRDGSDLPGATQDTLQADVAGAYRCRVTARNQSGEAAQTSDAHAVAAAPGGPPPGPGTTGPDTTPPRLSGVSLSHARFRVGRARTAIAATELPLARGTLLLFTSSEAGRLSIAIQRVRPGRRVILGRRPLCVAVRRAVRRGRCTVLTRTATLTRTIGTGRGHVALSGRIGVKPMAAGGYRLTLTARDAAGNVSKPVRLSFTVVSG